MRGIMAIREWLKMFLEDNLLRLISINKVKNLINVFILGYAAEQWRWMILMTYDVVAATPRWGFRWRCSQSYSPSSEWNQSGWIFCPSESLVGPCLVHEAARYKGRLKICGVTRQDKITSTDGCIQREPRAFRMNHPICTGSFNLLQGCRVYIGVWLSGTIPRCQFWILDQPHQRFLGWILKSVLKNKTLKK